MRGVPRVLRFGARAQGMAFSLLFLLLQYATQFLDASRNLHFALHARDSITQTASGKLPPRWEICR
jgi:hypothetical protein